MEKEDSGYISTRHRRNPKICDMFTFSEADDFTSAFLCYREDLVTLKRESPFL